METIRRIFLDFHVRVDFKEFAAALREFIMREVKDHNSKLNFVALYHRDGFPSWDELESWEFDNLNSETDIRKLLTILIPDLNITVFDEDEKQIIGAAYGIVVESEWRHIMERFLSFLTKERKLLRKRSFKMEVSHD